MREGEGKENTTSQIMSMLSDVPAEVCRLVTSRLSPMYFYFIIFQSETDHGRDWQNRMETVTLVCSLQEVI